MLSQEKDKLRVIPILQQCALEYQDELLDRNLLVMCSRTPEKRIFYHEFTFKSNNFTWLQMDHRDKSLMCCPKYCVKICPRR